MRSLQYFTWVSCGYLPRTDISCRPQFRRFLSSFICCYVFSKWNKYFFILVFSDPILFCLFLLLYTTFPVFYFLSFSSACLCTSSYFSLFFGLFLCLSSTFFLAVFYLSPPIFFVYHLLSLSASVSFFVFYFLSLSVFFYVPLTLQFILKLY